MNRVTKCFGSGVTSVTAVEDFSFDVAEGEFVSLIGPSGCGKTTLFHIIGGLTGDYQGRVTVAKLRRDLVPALRATAASIERDLAVAHP